MSTTSSVVDEVDIQVEVEAVMELEQPMELTVPKPLKRAWSEEEIKEQDWETVTGRNKKLRHLNGSGDINQNAVIYITSEVQLPKQFALARLFKDLQICDISNIKYLNPYKIRVTFEGDKSIEELTSIESLKTRGWRFSKSSVVSFSYGVIKDVDMELSEEEIIKNIICHESVELISVKRLSRRNRVDKEDRWIPSETVRLCFKGNYLPSALYVHGVRVKIEPYVYPVTQCFQCWALGHTAKSCIVKKDVCPKCGGDHTNCATKIFKCINCSGRHMAMAKICPAYIKERKIRLIMAENNYTYSKAAQIYAESPIITITDKRDPRAMTQVIMEESEIENTHNLNVATNIHESPFNAQSQESVILPPKHSRKYLKKTRNAWATSPEWNDTSNNDNSHKNIQQEKQSDEHIHEKTTLRELLSKIKEVIFMKNLVIQSKVKRVLKLCVEWIIIAIADNVSDWPVANLIYGLFNLNG